MRIIKDPQARVIGLENGEIHLSGFESQPRNINRLKKADHLTATPEGYGAIGPLDWLAFNTKEGPTSNVKVRQAIAHAVDRNFILKAIMFDTAVEANSGICLLYTSPSPRDRSLSRMPSSA